MLAARRRGTSPWPRFGTWTALPGSALATVDQVREASRGLLSDVIGTPGGGYAGWRRPDEGEEFERLGVPFEDTGVDIPVESAR
jgi:hypothetical protein